LSDAGTQKLISKVAILALTLPCVVLMLWEKREAGAKSLIISILILKLKVVSL
jgi:hypothetical protein